MWLLLFRGSALPNSSPTFLLALSEVMVKMGNPLPIRLPICSNNSNANPTRLLSQE
jgi:hypothetical protein